MKAETILKKLKASTKSLGKTIKETRARFEALRNKVEGLKR